MAKENSDIQTYEVVSVKRSAAPSGMEGSDWYKYVIAFGGSKSIQGCRQGKLSAVTEAVEEIVAQMNERHRGKRGRVHLVSTPKNAAAGKEAAKKTAKKT